MRTKIEALATYYRQFHHTLIGWQITLSGFVFAALLAADVANIKGNCLAVCCVYTAVILFPITFLAAIAQYGKRIELLDQYLDLPDKDIPSDWMKQHKKIGFTVTGAGSFYFYIIVLSQLGINLFLAYSRLS